MINWTELNDYFSTIISPSSKIPPKPNPTGIHVAIEQLGHEPKPAIQFVGDQVENARAAAAANVSFIWVLYGYQAENPMPAASLINDISELLERIKE